MLCGACAIEIAPSLRADVEKALEVIVGGVNWGAEIVDIFLCRIRGIMREGLEERAQPREVPGNADIEIVTIGERGGGANERLIRYKQ